MAAKDDERLTITDLLAESYALERTGKISAALNLAQAALQQARCTNSKENIAAALVCVAHCQHHLGHFDAACTLADEALTHSRPLSHSRADALRILGSCCHENGDLSRTEALYHQAIDIARQLGYPWALQSCLHSLSACVYIPRGQFELALAADEEAFRLALAIELPEIAWFPLVTMGWVYWVTGQSARAEAIIAEMQEYVSPGSMGEGYYFCLSADLAQEGDHPEAALPLYARARTIAEKVGDPGLNAELRVGLSRYYHRVGNAAAARQWAGDALAIARRAGSRDLQGWALIARGRTAWAMNEYAQAEADFREAIDLLTPMQANFDLARASLLLAALYQNLEHPAAESVWLQAITLIISGGYAFLLEKERGLTFPILASYLHSRNHEIASLSARLLEHLAHVPPSPLRIYTLGRFDVRQGGRMVPKQAWRQRRAGELFRLLLISPNRSALKEQIVQALWPDKRLSTAQALFHRATSSLRRALEPDLPDKFPSRYLVVDGGEVTLHLPTGTWIDHDAFEKYYGEQAWEEALSCYRGDLYPADLYADWAVGRRERLKHRAIQAALALAREGLAADRPDVALAACRRALALEPWQEEAVLLGMRACLAQNDRAGAIRLYQTLARTLRGELNIDPQEPLQAAYRTLMSS